MSIVTLAGLLILAAVASSLQTITGFALGLIMMGGIGITGLLPLDEAAVLVSLLVLVNAGLMLVKGWRAVAWRPFLAVLVTSLAMLLVGYWLLDRLMAQSVDLLKLILGVVIIVSSLQLLIRPAPLQRLSPLASFAGFGTIAGLMSGLFSTAGPPLVYHFYRQPLPHATIRETLVAVFAANSLVRMGAVSLSGRLPGPSFWWALLCIPVVIFCTMYLRKFPPRLSPLAIRRMAFALLCLSGVALAIGPVLKLTGLM